MASSGGYVKDYFWEGLKASTNDTMEIPIIRSMDKKDIGAPAVILPISKVQKSTLKTDSAAMIRL